jgi:hypothetical protein
MKLQHEPTHERIEGRQARIDDHIELAKISFEERHVVESRVLSHNTQTTRCHAKVVRRTIVTPKPRAQDFDQHFPSCPYKAAVDRVHPFVISHTRRSLHSWIDARTDDTMHLANHRVQGRGDVGSAS